MTRHTAGRRLSRLEDRLTAVEIDAGYLWGYEPPLLPDRKPPVASDEMAIARAAVQQRWAELDSRIAALETATHGTRAVTGGAAIVAPLAPILRFAPRETAPLPAQGVTAHGGTGSGPSAR